MEKHLKPLSFLWLFGFASFFSILVIPHIFSDSPTNDEPGELTNGYFYWQGDVVTHNRHPPFSILLQALPLRLIPLKEAPPSSTQDKQLRSYDFFFILNKNRYEWMTAGGRWVTFLFGLGIGLLLFLQTRRSLHAEGLAALILWAFHPTILAYSTLSIADIPVTFFFLAAILAFQRRLEKPDLRWSLASGALAAAACCSKFSALALIPIFVLLEALRFSREPAGKKAGFPGLVARDWAWGAGAFIVFISAVYLPGTLLQPDHRPPLVYFLRGLSNMMGYSGFHHPTYFLGQATRQNHWLYFPVAFGLKNTIPFTFLVMLGTVKGLRRKKIYPPWMWITPVLFFLCVLPVQNLGIRYLLPSFPFLILMAARTLGAEWDRGKRAGRRAVRLALGGLLLWNAVSVLVNQPNLISYFNDFIPPENKIRYLADNDLDIGQDLKRLAQVGKERGWKEIKLAQFGGALDPSLYGLSCRSWTQRDLSGPQPGEVYAVNLSLFQIGPVFWPDLLPIAQGWAATTPPTGRVGDTWVYFEMPGKPTMDFSPSLSTIRIF